MKTKINRNSAFTLVEIMIVVAIIGLLAAIAIPNFIRARTTAQKNACINNLRQIDGAIQQWALESKASPGDTVTFPQISGYLKNAVVCPAGGAGASFGSTYSINTVQDKPVCRIDSVNHILPPDTGS